MAMPSLFFLLLFFERKVTKRIASPEGESRPHTVGTDRNKIQESSILSTPINQFQYPKKEFAPSLYFLLSLPGLAY